MHVPVRSRVPRTYKRIPLLYSGTLNVQRWRNVPSSSVLPPLPQRDIRIIKAITYTRENNFLVHVYGLPHIRTTGWKSSTPCEHITHICCLISLFDMGKNWHNSLLYKTVQKLVYMLFNFPETMLVKKACQNDLSYRNGSNGVRSWIKK